MKTLYFTGIIEDGSWMFSNGKENNIHLDSGIDFDDGTHYICLYINETAGEVFKFMLKPRRYSRDLSMYDALEFKRNTEKTARELGYQISYDMPPWYSEQEAAKED